MPSPPHARDEAPLLDLLQIHLATLYREGLARRLVDTFGSAGAALSAPAAALRSVPGLTAPLLGRLTSAATAREAREELLRARDSGWSLVATGDPRFPPALDVLPGMPLLLFVAGRPGLFSEPGVAIVGSRRPSPYGLRQARRFAGDLARRGLIVTSGLALGVDGEAHRGALEAGGATIAVLGSGLGRIYPREHEALARAIASSGGGALVSELPSATPPRSFHFPMRNRLLSALAQGVLVVEASEKSGSLITVGFALEQGKPVYAVPGRVDQPEARGCLRLLVDGAAPAIDPDDVLPRLGKPVPSPAAIASPTLPGPLGEALTALFQEEDIWHADRIAARLGKPAREVVLELSRLELAGRLERAAGGGYVLRGVGE
jgi:DNA processing protein